MRALVVGSKQKAFFSLLAFGLLGPFLTFLPLTLVFNESGSLGLGMTLATLFALLITITYGLLGLGIAAFTFAVVIGMSQMETLSVWALWSALSSGTLVTYFGSRELVDSLEEKEDPAPSLRVDDHRLVTLQKLLQLTRHQLGCSNSNLESCKGEIANLKERVKLGEGLFEEQNEQISTLFEKVREAQKWRLELDQLAKGDEALLSKACAYDQLLEQFVEKQETLAHTRRELELAHIESEGLARELQECTADGVVERLKNQLAGALCQLEKAHTEQKELMGLISLWSKNP